MEENKKGEILLYQTIDGVSKIEVTVYNDIVWLLDQVAELFQRNILHPTAHASVTTSM